MSKYTAKQIAESDDLFDKQIHKVRKFYLSRNPDKMMMLEERKAVIKERNKGLSLSNDGRKIISNDWWHQGKIPEEFKDLMPDNAKWVK